MNGNADALSALSPARYFAASVVVLALIFALLEPAGAPGLGVLSGFEPVHALGQPDAT